MPALASDVSQDRATGEVLRDLIDALLADGLVVVRPAVPGDSDARTDGDERWAKVPIGGGRRLAFRVRPALFPRSWRCSRGPVLLLGAAGAVPAPLDPAGVIRALARPSWAALHLVAADLATAPATAAAAGEAAPRVLDALAGEGPTAIVSEQVAALGDRPFHPLGRHKRGWDGRDAARWGPHAHRPFGLDWWAVPRDLLVAGDRTRATGGEAGTAGDGWGGNGTRHGRPQTRAGTTGDGSDRDRTRNGHPQTRAGTNAGDGTDASGVPADVLDAVDRQRLRAAMARRGLADGDHLVVPVHPWQARHLGGPGPAGVPLATGLGAFRATASLRTLVPAGRPDVHLKLPLAVATLGAGRQLPVRYLRNGDRAQRLLAAVSGHPALGGRVHVCDETTWWTAPGPAAAGLADEGEVGCQLRRYPPHVVRDPGVTLVPLGALGVTVGDRAPVLDTLAGPPQQPVARGTGTALLADLTTELVRLGVVGLAHGVMPEAHGQNVVVMVRHGGPDRPADHPVVAGLVLRDHDAVRIHPPWLRAAGLPDPGYVVDGRTPNTLVAGSPEGLLAWFQMLGVHLGLHPIVRALGVTTGLDEAAGWRTIATATAACLDELRPVAGLEAAVDVARSRLLDAPTWPVKLVMGPLLERGEGCGTSMPSAVGSTANPLRAALGSERSPATATGAPATGATGTPTTATVTGTPTTATGTPTTATGAPGTDPRPGRSTP